MLPQNQDTAFAQLIVALDQLSLLPNQHRETVKQFRDYVFERIEGPVPDDRFMPESADKLIDAGIMGEDEGTDPMPRFPDLKAGLEDLKWSSWPHGPRSLGSGTYGCVQLIHKTEDMDLPFPQRRMAALKIQLLTDANAHQLWTEMSVLNCVKHKNIVNYYGAFVVTPETGRRYQSEIRRGLHADSPAKEKSEEPLIPRHAESEDEDDTDAPDSKMSEKEKQLREKRKQIEKQRLRDFQVQDTFCILMEYANAGTLHDEILRYPNRHMTEIGARYYMREIIAGVSYLHKKLIVHEDLHLDNVLLKYNSNGITKRCLICDFVNCAIPIYNEGTLNPSAYFPSFP